MCRRNLQYLKSKKGNTKSGKRKYFPYGKGNPEANITILIATGCHRGTTKDELVSKFGKEIVEKENIYVHDCDEREKLHMIPAHSIDEAIAKAKKILGKNDVTITAIPDGVSVVVR